MSVFIDTSAFLALLDAADRHHAGAAAAWQDLLDRQGPLVVTNYVLVEVLALVQHRLGQAAVHAFQQDIAPMLQVVWIDEIAHAAGVAGLLAANRRQLSLVDCVSFETMRELGIDTAFTFDRYFAKQQFRCVP